MNRVFSLAVSARTTCIRPLSATQVRCKDPLAKIKEKQIYFQKNDDVPVYLKGGTSDHIMFFISMSLIFVSLGASLHSLYKLTQKK